MRPFGAGRGRAAVAPPGLPYKLMPDSIPQPPFHPAVWIALAAALGLAVGHVLEVMRLRLPRALESEWWSAVAEAVGDTEALSHFSGQRRGGWFSLRMDCPGCGRPLHGGQSVPLLRSVGFGGRCAGCGRSVPARFPTVELVSASLSALVAWRFGWGAAAAGALLLTWALIALGAIDLETRLLPDTLTYPLLWLGLLFNLAGVFAPLADAVLGAAGGYLILWGVFHGYRLLTGKEAMGYGDFKLLAAVGAWLGWQALPFLVLLSSGFGALVGIVLLASGRHRREAPLPFGPYLAAAGWLGLMWGGDFLHGFAIH